MRARLSHRSSVNAGYTSPFQYAYAALAVVEYKDNEYDCPYPPENPLCLNFDGTYNPRTHIVRFLCLHVSCVVRVRARAVVRVRVRVRVQETTSCRSRI